jgi:hypothetical protein
MVISSTVNYLIYLKNIEKQKSINRKGHKVKKSQSSQRKIKKLHREPQRIHRVTQRKNVLICVYQQDLLDIKRIPCKITEQAPLQGVWGATKSQVPTLSRIPGSIIS